MIDGLVAFLAVLVFWALLVSVAVFVVLAGWCVLAELNEVALRRRLRRGASSDWPYRMPVLVEGRRRRG